ncbi:hypothetical protein F4677DRAFT_400348 [Hypoxylon crocopeplum]|nr:hypothetical protein F4677DRAFT_400348 [Hypoxylon crocopeplum]
MAQLHYVTKLGSTADASWDNIPASLPADVEIMVGFLATSIAKYRPLYRLIFKGGDSIPLSHGRNQKSDYAENRYGKDNHDMNIYVGERPRSDSASDDLWYGITITDEIELVRHDNV